MKDTLYDVGDTVIINKIKWEIESIRYVFGRMWVYDLNGVDIDDHLVIDTGSLETILNYK